MFRTVWLLHNMNLDGELFLNLDGELVSLITRKSLDRLKSFLFEVVQFDKL